MGVNRRDSRLCEEKANELQGGVDTRSKTSKRKNEVDIWRQFIIGHSIFK